MLEKLWKIHAYERRLWYLGILCVPLSLFYRSLSFLKKSFYGFFAFFRIRSQNPVIVIGNLTVGGSGKTPLTLHCLDYLCKHYTPPRLITRGYGARFSGPFANFEKGSWDRPGFFGDETETCVRLFPEISVSVGKRRGICVLENSKKNPEEIMILDDGLQYWRLEKDFTLVTIHGHQVFGNGRIFPQGPLREDPRELGRASAVVIVYPVKPREDYLNLLKSLGYDGPLFLADSSLGEFYYLATGQPCLDLCSDQPWVLATSIAHPETFRTQIEGLGHSVGKHFIFGDHHEFSRGEQQRILASLDRYGAKFLCLTEKDVPKWTLKDSRVLVARQNLKIDRELEFFDLIHQYIQSKIKPAP